jgi:hypothetical protein
MNNAFKPRSLGAHPLGSKTSGTVQFRVNSQDSTHPISLIEQHKKTMKAFELYENEQREINPCIKNLALYERDWYR